jgi:hypothetical protein
MLAPVAPEPGPVADDDQPALAPDQPLALEQMQCVGDACPPNTEHLADLIVAQLDLVVFIRSGFISSHRQRRFSTASTQVGGRRLADLNEEDLDKPDHVPVECLAARQARETDRAPSAANYPLPQRDRTSYGASRFQRAQAFHKAFVAVMPQPSRAFWRHGRQRSYASSRKT